ncbi:dTDP-4-dehydrorhamnose 3,5-epimerase family protein [Nocardioides zeae]|uniref:dTDP-4-keto-6-deoxy-D-glucose epimerase n=1 Tax=Nocardioides zeae TaxID=1457234 RepID=A0A6P0HGT5_9ACTN|nr:dTDP-4-dehydrorhamnose 3,5-epimerase [Nocardioides zeae]NEN77791.1 dTDP-4-keto-6-deoxy-D-glucose epimerase [Nocardioides zeae]
MKVVPTRIEGAWTVTPVQIPDERGVFLESFRRDTIAELTGHDLDVWQTNVSVSGRGTVRGVHFADVPPGQAKYVTALTGSFLDFVVDLRVGSPTFGTWESVRLDSVDRRAVLIGEGLGHAFCALEDASTVLYLCSSVYAPERERTVSPLDPALGLPIPADIEPVMSARDSGAPTLEEALAAGLLPSYGAADGAREGATDLLEQRSADLTSSRHSPQILDDSGRF